MRLDEFKTKIKESSTLSSLGVPYEAIHQIHDRLGLKHDVEYEPIKNKTLAKIAIKKENDVIIAINPEGETFAIGPWNNDINGTYYVMFVPPGSYGGIESITKAFKAVSGKGWKYYVSTSPAPSKTKSIRRPEYNYGRKFIDEVVEKFNEPIKERAAAAYETIRSHLMDLAVSEEDPRTGMSRRIPQDKDMNEVKKVMRQMKGMAENGLHGYFSYSERDGSIGAIKNFFAEPLNYKLDSATELFKENEKLAVHKFVKFVYQEIQKQVDIYTTGNFAKHSKKAKDYDKEREGAE